MRCFHRFFFLALLLWTFVVWVLHCAVVRPPYISPNEQKSPPPPLSSYWFPKQKYGLNHAFLKGSAFERGRQFGRASQELLRQQEEALNASLQDIVPSAFLRQSLMFFSMIWFQGIDRYLEDDWLREMWGVSLSAPKEFNHLADPFTRQVAYHGLHEVGQMLVDQGFQGCTQIAHSVDQSWIIGRTFDFEAHPIFDKEKILKWVYPKNGFAFVSVIFAGMVGSVTGVNEMGVYIAINAAGSEDFSRLGTPSTLLVTQALQESSTAEEAVQILKNKKSLITDIYLVAGPTGPLYQVEKSPHQTKVIQSLQSRAVTNHLMHSGWEKDKVNLYRQQELTTMTRLRRAKEFLEDWQNSSPPNNRREWHQKMLEAIRDKKGPAGQPLHLGHRSAIDALIATHGVIYDSKLGVLYVSQGPSLVGPFLGYSLAESFQKSQPVEVHRLPPDPLLTKERYYSLKSSFKKYQAAFHLAKHGQCLQAEKIIQGLHEAPAHHHYTMTKALLYECHHQPTLAHQTWQKALAQNPAYRRDYQLIQEKLNGSVESPK